MNYDHWKTTDPQTETLDDNPQSKETPQSITFDYVNQAWIVNGHYIRCGHPDNMQCDCYGRLHQGELARTND